jgi:hypothetical protein
MSTENLLTPPDVDALRGLVAAKLTTVVWDHERAPWEALDGKLARMRGWVRPDRLVFRIDLPLVLLKERKRKPKPGEVAKPPIRIVLCPSMNEYSRMKGFAHAAAIKEVDAMLSDARASWPASWHWGGEEKTWIEPVFSKTTGKTRDVVRRNRWGGKRRGVRVVRHSSRRIDETATDVLGGKIPIDRLVEMGVLGGDSALWCERRGEWVAAKPGEGHLLVEVYDIEGDEGVVKVGEK